jgi:hypothetical protein
MSSPTAPSVELDPETLLNVAAEDHMQLWAEVIQLRARDRKQAARIVELEQAVRDAAVVHDAAPAQPPA